ncbi:MAG: hypothetical protein QME42_01850 [bacterium]|nr:hypothetical protein [bacterium]
MIQILQIIFSSIGCIAIVMFLVLFYIEAKRHHRESNEYRFLRDKDTQTIMNLTKEKETLREDITSKLSVLTSKEEERQNLLFDILRRLEDKEKGREEDLMNWLEFKAKKWQEQIDDRVSERINKFQTEISNLSKKIIAIEAGLVKDESPTASTMQTSKVEKE